jgi:hypothetical protein
LSSPVAKAAARAQARLRYVATHWGLTPKEFEEATAPDPDAEPLTGLGELIAITYRTHKGHKRGLAPDWTHKFEKSRPILAYHSGGLIIVGGDYHVSARGIVG